MAKELTTLQIRRMLDDVVAGKPRKIVCYEHKMSYATVQKYVGFYLDKKYVWKVEQLDFFLRPPLPIRNI